MRKNKKKSTQDIRVKIANIIIVVLSVVLLITASILGSRLNRKRYRTVDTVSSMMYEIKASRYPALVNSWKSNLKYGYTLDEYPAYEEVYAVAEYFDTGIRYRVYKEMGYTDKAEKAHQIMMDDVEKMADLDFTISEMNEIIGIE